MIKISPVCDANHFSAEGLQPNRVVFVLMMKKAATKMITLPRIRIILFMRERENKRKYKTLLHYALHIIHLPTGRQVMHSS
jgi:hypothetical protein